MKSLVRLLSHYIDCGIYEKDDDYDSDVDGYNNNTKDMEYYKEVDEEEEDGEYYEFDSDNNKRRIGPSDNMGCLYKIICQCYQAKGWEHNNRCIKTLMDYQ